MKHAKQNFPHSSSHFLLCHRTIEQVSLIVFSFETRLIIVIRAFPFNVRFIDKTMFESFVPNKDHCQLCLDTVPCVQCTQCSIQYFCSECDQLYHKHIARKNHVRNRMPGFEHTQSIDSNESKLLIADPKKMPIPPPRRRKKESDQNGHTNAVNKKYEWNGSKHDTRPMIPPFVSFKSPQVTTSELHKIRAKIMARNSQEQMQQIQTLMHWNRMKQTEQQLQQQHLQRQRLNERNERLWQNQMLQQQIRSRAASMTQLNVYTSSPMSRPYIEQHSGECGWNGSVPMMQMSTDPYRTNHGRSISTADLAQSVSPAQFARVDRHTLNKSHDRWLQLQSPTPRPSSNVGLQMKLDSERLALNRRHVSLNDIRSQLSHNASPTFRKTTLQSTNHSNPYSFHNSGLLSAAQSVEELQMDAYDDLFRRGGCTDEYDYDEPDFFQRHDLKRNSIKAYGHCGTKGESHRKSNGSLHHSLHTASTESSTNHKALHRPQRNEISFRRCQSAVNLDRAKSAVPDAKTLGKAVPFVGIDPRSAVPTIANPLMQPLYAPFNGSLMPANGFGPTLLQPVYMANGAMYTHPFQPVSTVSPASSMHSLQAVCRKNSVQSVESIGSNRVEVRTIRRAKSNDSRSAYDSSEQRRSKSRMQRNTSEYESSENDEQHEAAVNEDVDEKVEQKDERKNNEEESQSDCRDEKNRKNKKMAAKSDRNYVRSKKSTMATVDRINSDEIRAKSVLGWTTASNATIDSAGFKASNNRGSINRGRWKCVQCRFVNRSNSDVCEVCCRTNPWRKTATPVQGDMLRLENSSKKWNKKRIQSQDSAYYDDDDLGDELNEDEQQKDDGGRRGSNHHHVKLFEKENSAQRKRQESFRKCKNFNESIQNYNCNNADDDQTEEEDNDDHSENHPEQSSSTESRTSRLSLKSYDASSKSCDENRPKQTKAIRTSSIKFGQAKVNSINCASSSNQVEPFNFNSEQITFHSTRSTSSPVESDVQSIEFDLMHISPDDFKMTKNDDIDPPTYQDQSTQFKSNAMDSFFDTITETNQTANALDLIDLSKESSVDLRLIALNSSQCNVNSYKEDLDQLEDFATQLIQSPIHFQTNQIFVDQAASSSSSAFLSSHLTSQSITTQQTSIDENRWPSNQSKSIDVRWLDEAEKAGIDLVQLKIGIQMEPSNPVEWLRQNWSSMVGTVVNLANTHRIMMTNERSAKHDRLDGGWRLVREQEADKAVRESNGNIWKAVEVLVSDQDHDATIHVPELTVDTEPVHHNPNNESSQDSACSLQDDDVIKPMETTNTLSPLDLDSKAIAIDTLSEKVAISEQDIPTSDLESETIGLETMSLHSRSKPYFQYARTQFICPICCAEFRKSEMHSFLICGHDVCNGCAVEYFHHAIYNKVSPLIGCAVCHRPTHKELEDVETDELFRIMLQAQLSSLLSPKDFQLFDQKLRDVVLGVTNVYRECAKCQVVSYIDSDHVNEISSDQPSSINCSNCESLLCMACGMNWVDEHLKMDCVEYKQFMENHPLDSKAKTSQKLEYNANIIECPKCRYRYELVRGGCMHYTCSNCSYQFCECCRAEFRHGREHCNARFMCKLGGLHGHHPRHCSFYTRDFSCVELKNLLMTYGIKYNESISVTIKEKRTSDPDQLCHESGCAYKIVERNLCNYHFEYKDYLCKLVYKHRVDTLSLLTEEQILAIYSRENILMPTKISSTTYRDKLIQSLQEKLPLTTKY